MAIDLWRQHPTKIESDIERFYPRWSIEDWHQGRMTSRKFLALVTELPDDSAFKIATSWSGWSLSTTLLAKIHEEFALYRSSKYAGGEHAYNPMVYVPPKEQERQALQEAVEAEHEQQSRNELLDGMGWS